MSRSFAALVVLGMLVLFIPAMGQETGIPPIPFIEAEVATEGPLSLFCLPNGAGTPFTAAMDPFGSPVDGTLSIVLWNDSPAWGSPIPDFPREDIWLMDDEGGLAICSGGSIPDEDTDDFGRTYWANPLRLGGHFEPGSQNRLGFWVNGWSVYSPNLDELRFNSADLDGNGAVNLTDVVLFTQGYFGPYDYSFDFRYDGTINLSDLAMMAYGVGAVCP